MSTTPLFTIVIPVFNRQREIQRALQSCLAQPYSSFEVIVVDDASTDGTVDAARLFTEPRVSICRHDRNRGVCAARNTGVAQAHGEWIVFLDSDDELLPDALQKMAARTSMAPRSVHRLAFNYVDPDGRISPAPSCFGEFLDYTGYLRWAERATRSDFNNCVRRWTFDAVPLPESRIYERIYHLEFARRFNTLLAPEVVARVHYDAPNRLANVSLSCYVQRQMAEAGDGVAGIEQVLAAHGEALRQHAPRIYRSLLRQRFEMLFLAGRIVQGIRAGLAFVRSYPRAASGWATLIAGLFGPASVAALKFVGSRRRA